MSVPVLLCGVFGFAGGWLVRSSPVLALACWAVCGIIIASL